MGMICDDVGGRGTMRTKMGNDCRRGRVSSGEGGEYGDGSDVATMIGGEDRWWREVEIIHKELEKEGIDGTEGCEGCTAKPKYVQYEGRRRKTDNLPSLDDLEAAL